MIVWVLPGSIFYNLLEKLNAHEIPYDMYVGNVVTEKESFISVCIEVNGKNYCKGDE